ncbi:MAG: hypothetical protein AAFP76_06385 [Bacteroidota bacterium]
MSTTNPHNLPGNTQLLKKLEGKVATVYFYDNVVITEGVEGAKIDYKSGFALLVHGVNFINNRPFVYISNRINDYETHPRELRYFQLAPYIKGVAIVTQKYDDSDREALGSTYFKKPFRVFSDLIEAYHWAQEVLAREK